MRNYLVFNGHDSRDYGVYISGEGTFSAPQKTVNFLAVPGKNGDLIGASSRFQNITVTYPAFIYSNFNENIRNFRSMLNSINGYAELTDSYHADEFRLAAYADEFEPKVQPKNDAGAFDIVFNCKPQRFLVSGKNSTTYTATSFTVTNPTLFPSKPILEVYVPSGNSGIFSIGSQSITVNNPGGTTIIDCEMQDCYYGSTNLNKFVTFSNYKFPELKPGINNIALTSGMSIKIQGNWWWL